MRPIIGITMGDPAGIGAEVTVKALNRKTLYRQCIPVVIGDYAAIEEAIHFCNLSLSIRCIDHPNHATGTYGILELIDLHCLPKEDWRYQEVSASCGEAAFMYIRKAISLAMEGSLHAIVTAPINKEALNLAGHHYSGHTELFCDLTGSKDCAMLLISKTLNVIHVTTHVALRDVVNHITSERVYQVIRMAEESMILLGILTPRIAVAGLNPHCSEHGLFGDEESNKIIPAIERAKKQGINVEGPISPDIVFVKACAGLYDIVVAMYHDQGHIPLKLANFKINSVSNSFTSLGGVNCTVGLPIIRTSVDHGTAFDRAGKGCSNENSMVEAIKAALKMARHTRMNGNSP